MRSASVTSSQPARARPWKTVTSGRCCFCERDTAGWSRLPLTPDNAGGVGNLSELPAAAQPVAASLLKAHAHQLSAGGNRRDGKAPDSPICRFNTELGSVLIPLADLSSSARK
jgi:hypothetical protein